MLKLYGSNGNVVYWDLKEVYKNTNSREEALKVIQSVSKAVANITNGVTRAERVEDTK